MVVYGWVSDNTGGAFGASFVHVNHIARLTFTDA